MKNLSWLIAGIGLGVTAYIVWSDQSQYYSTRSEGADHAADKAYSWGTKQRVGGKARGVVGNLKEGWGTITGDADLEGEGAAEQVAGKVKDAAGSVAQAASETIRDLNR